MIIKDKCEVMQYDCREKVIKKEKEKWKRKQRLYQS